MKQDLFVTGPRDANDLAGVFECEEGVPYFYLYRTDAPVGSKVIGAIPVFLNMEGVSEGDIAIYWSASEDIVGLFLRGELVAAFEVSSGEKFGGTDLEGNANPLPTRIITEFWRPVGSIALIRRHPGMYFRGGVVSLDQLSSRVVEDIGARDAHRAEILSRPPYALAAADYDWMLTPRADVPTLFRTFIPPEVPQINGIRSEVLIAAVCHGFATWGPAGDVASDIEESDIPDDLLARRATFVRVLIWKMPTV